MSLVCKNVSCLKPLPQTRHRAVLLWERLQPRCLCFFVRMSSQLHGLLVSCRSGFGSEAFVFHEITAKAAPTVLMMGAVA